MNTKKEQYQILFTQHLLNNTHKKIYSLNDVEKIINKVIDSCVPKIVTSVLEQQSLNSELKLYTRKEVCDILDVTTTTLHNYKHQGKLVPIKKNGKVYYKAADLNNYINKQ
ncbi:helix-turn-helix domain-containing protein [Winogradskyella sp. F6397]|uniref:Helix-turn-helix domain-containing protein n=1 Tax=Winogradskyella marina TaxID=2785530 RepID=A0ABS0EPC7_9FLAO|nr:helix-turn-helix domain-containing protein [Winogradskyella marina]MBF8151305.1 helix-turn-helix domain-containing protein [Winogradskyella marina]